MAEAPGQAEAGRPTAPVRDQRRHGGEMVGVGGVAQSQKDGDRHDQQHGCAVGEVDEPGVEAEHQTETFPSARTTMPIPASTITAALTAGRTAARRPRPANRANAPSASTATSPTPVIAAARPTLNAPTRARPNPTRRSGSAARHAPRA